MLKKQKSSMYLNYNVRNVIYFNLTKALNLKANLK